MDHPVHERLAHLVPHWIEHNDSHTETYRQWADRARAAGLPDTAGALGRAVEAARALTRELQAALDRLAREAPGGTLKNPAGTDEG